MTVNIINGSGIGWTLYTLGRHGEREHSKLIMGDTALGDTICKSVEHYKSGSAVKMVISFAYEDNVTPKQGREIVKEFVGEFMYGFREDEYHEDIVEHTDTNYLHYHIRIPKKNLLTGTQLKPYYHKADLSYKIALIDHIAHKYNLIVGTDNKKLVGNPKKKVDQINEWRTKHGQKPFELSTKVGRKEAEERLLDYFSEMNMQGFISCLDDVKSELVTIGFTVAKEGHDISKDFDYITVKNNSGKIRLKGDIYGRGFYQHIREDRAKAISNNRSIDKRSRNDKRSGSYIEQALHKERTKRLEWIDKQYGTARKRSLSRFQEIERLNEKELDQNAEDIIDVSSTGHSDIGIFIGSIDNIPNQRSSGNLDKIRELFRQDSDVGGRNEVHTSKSNCQGVVNDRIRTEAIRRIRKLRTFKRARDERLRAQLKSDSESFNRNVSTSYERDIQVSASRAASLNNIVKRIRKTADADHRAVKDAIKARAEQRRDSENLSTTISIISKRFGELFERVKQEFNRRAQNLAIGVVNIVQKKKFLETEIKPGVLSEDEDDEELPFGLKV